MATFTLTQRVNAPIDTTWSLWDDYGNIDIFHPGLSQSFLLDSSPQTGVGAKRQCDMSDGKNWIKEEIIEYEKGSKIVLNAYEGTMPLKKAVAGFYFKAINMKETQITFVMNFETKMGILGKLMTPMIKGKLSKVMMGVLQSSADHAEKTYGKVAA